MGLSNLDFLNREPARCSGWRLALLLAGALALLPAAAHWLAQAQAVSRLEAQLAQAQPRKVERPRLAPERQREHDAQLKLVADAVRQLNLPVTRLIKTVQAPRDVRVALLGLDLNGEAGADQGGRAAGALKIAAEAETAQDMINYLAFLNQQSLFRSVYLVKHEMNVAAPEHPYRFQLEAQWRQ
ncbi:hypothetical protein ACFDR9_003669 [Janthinobacterium sp. CG_23.3]|uniref:hypothetical protein n=1 Tax=unclassified Janthinobacterium TaxID=2610881 RepID=UPI000349B470|nr:MULTISPECIES: hypothetical protein [unclassified Janthinobacterium]MEC5161782.1 hypothetical protein [Janthinobacterium sp. CG_S6]